MTTLSIVGHLSIKRDVCRDTATPQCRTMMISLKTGAQVPVFLRLFPSKTSKAPAAAARQLIGGRHKIGQLRLAKNRDKLRAGAIYDNVVRA
jgi:hypothetical protein